jgi:hypothetical protein
LLQDIFAVAMIIDQRVIIRKFLNPGGLSTMIEENHGGQSGRIFGNDIASQAGICHMARITCLEMVAGVNSIPHIVFMGTKVKPHT